MQYYLLFFRDVTQMVVCQNYPQKRNYFFFSFFDNLSTILKKLYEVKLCKKNVATFPFFFI